MNEFIYEKLNLDNVKKYCTFFEKEIKVYEFKEDLKWLINRNSIEYMMKILSGKQSEDYFENGKGEKVLPLFVNNFTQIVLDKKGGKVVAIIDAREFHNELDKGNYLNIWWILVNKKFVKKGIASKLYDNLEKHGKKIKKIDSIYSGVNKKNIASYNLQLKKGYKERKIKSKIDTYFILDVK